jgi:hypothetical protein
MFENLPKQEGGGVFKSGQNKKLFFDSLPNEFQRKEAIELGNQFKISARTVDDILKKCKGNLLISTKPGHFEKS